MLTAASNVTGEFWPVERLAAVARRHGARVLLDAAQFAAHRPIDLGALDVDWVAFSGHKVHAPYGTGVLAGRRDWLDAARPYLAGGGATAQVTETSVRWSTGAARHEAGSPNVLGAIALAAACATIRAHRAAIEHHEAALTEQLVDGLRGIDGVTTYSLFGDDTERGPVVTFTVDGLDSHLVAAALSAEHGIGVRAGKFCAHILVDTLLDEGSDEHDTAVRVSAGPGEHPGARRAAARRRRDARRRRTRCRLRAHRRAWAGCRSTTPASSRHHCPGDARVIPAGDVDVRARTRHVPAFCHPSADLTAITRHVRAFCGASADRTAITRHVRAFRGASADPTAITRHVPVRRTTKRPAGSG